MADVCLFGLPILSKQYMTDSGEGRVRRKDSTKPSIHLILTITYERRGYIDSCVAFHAPPPSFIDMSIFKIVTESPGYFVFIMKEIGI